MELTHTQFLSDEAETLACAKKLAQAIQDPVIIYLYGPLGAGKTTFSRGLLQGLGYVGKVKSPTYTLVEPYEFDTFFLYHFDLYRVMDPKELDYIGIQDYFQPHAICLIEWPEKGKGFLPAADLSCYIDLEKAGRRIKMTADSSLGEAILKRAFHET